MPKPFGHTADRLEREAKDRARRAELNAKYRAEQKRLTFRDDLDRLFRRQNARIKATLKAASNRILAARWNVSTEHEDGIFCVTRSGTCEVSKPIRRDYREQETGK